MVIPAGFDLAAARCPPGVPAMRHHWWHRPADGFFHAIATDESGAIVSAWVQAGHNHWEPLDDFTPLVAADSRGEWHKNPDGYTDELRPSRGARS